MAAHRRTVWRSGRSAIRWMRADGSGLEVGLYCGHTWRWSLTDLAERSYLLSLSPGQSLYCQECPSSRAV